ncbi:MAG: ATP-binding protein [Pseudomonadota bacterium]
MTERYGAHERPCDYTLKPGVSAASGPRAVSLLSFPFKPAFASAGLVLGTASAHAQTALPAQASVQGLIDGVSAPTLIVASSVVAGVCMVALTGMVLALAALRRLTRKTADVQQAASVLRNDLDLAEAMVETSGDGLLELVDDGALRVVHGPVDRTALPADPAVLRDFSRWIEPADGRALRDAIAELRGSGKGFSTDARTLSGTLIHAEGRPVGARLVVRLRDLSRLQRDFAEALHLSANLEAESQRLKQLLNAVDFPIWTADASGLVSWSNEAFKARGAGTDGNSSGLVKAHAVVGQQAQWSDVEAMHADGQALVQITPPVPGGRDELGDVEPAGDQLVHLRLDGGDGSVLTAGFARPVSEKARFETALEQVHRNQAQILNTMRTAVIGFSAERHVSFYNEAFAQLFGFQRRVLDEKPHESTVLTYIKSTRQMPESGHHRGWRDPFAAVYRAERPLTEDWELHDGRYLRVILAPSGDGGAIWLFENETEKYDLTSRFAAETQARKASLEALREGVAVFGSDGCLQLINPAFGALWSLSDGEMAVGSHAKVTTTPIREAVRDRHVVDRIVGMIGSLGHAREEFSTRMQLTDDRVVDLLVTPLPGGATMLTADDVTAAIAVEDTLRESNAALEEAARIKTAFIKHVSYELRSPLTPIVGFTELLLTPDTGPLNERQSEYLGYVRASTNTLKVLVDSILDLATVDAGMLALSFDKVDPDALIDEAMAGIETRISDGRMHVDRKLDPSVPHLMGDRTRLRQVLYNLMSNAISFSKPGSGIRVRTRALAREDGQWIELLVIDHGPGMNAKQAAAAFEPFETGSNRHGTGAGLGLTLSRALVELHGGSVELWSREGLGTVVRCLLPGPARVKSAAE